MADFHYREKLKQIEKAASTNMVPEGAQKHWIGVLYFCICFLLHSLFSYLFHYG